MTPKSNLYRSRHGAALVLVLAMIVIMTGLVITVFVSVTGERRSAAVKVQGMSASQLASSAPQLVMSQIQNAVGTGSTPWTSQPGMIRTFDATSGNADRVYKLYSASRMSEQNFTETTDAPPSDWNSSKNLALFCDINRPATSSTSALASASAALIYPIADPSVANVDFDRNENTKVPGYQIKSNDIPGYDSGGTASPTNNPLPMPVRWLYILKDGRMAVPNGVSEDKVVSFTPDDQAQSIAAPSATNPVVGRIAFWADDDTCKVNINTAGYAKNDNSYWTYWDTPVGQTQEESNYLSWGQPWKNEFQRYPGHPATTSLNVIFDSIQPSTPFTDEDILSITPRFRAGGTRGGTIQRKTPPLDSEVADLKKNERLFPSVDEMSFKPELSGTARETNTNISRDALEARRFLLTANSRAPEVTLWNTPRTTIWPTFQTVTKRTAIDSLISFCSTIGGQPFYFVRESAMTTNELTGIPQNQNLWNYLMKLSDTPVPGFGGKFTQKYGTQVQSQVLTSIYDAIRLANLDDRTGSAANPAIGYSFTGGDLIQRTGTYALKSTNYTGGFVAPAAGPNGTRAPGRASALAEVAFLFARTDSDTTPDSENIRPIDRVKCAVFYGFYNPAAGMIQPGQNRRIIVRGLNQFTVTVKKKELVTGGTAQQIFPESIMPGGVYERTEVDTADPSRREFGGRIEWTLSMTSGTNGQPVAGMPANSGNAGPITGNIVLPYPKEAKPADNDAKANGDDYTFEFSGGTLTVEVYYPSNTLFQTYQIAFPKAEKVLTPILVPFGSQNTPWVALSGTGSGRFPPSPLSYYDQRFSFPGDTLLAMQNRTGAFGYEVTRSGIIDDFVTHARYGRSDILLCQVPTGAGTKEKLSRRGSSMRWASSNTILNSTSNAPLNDVIFGRLITGYNDYSIYLTPTIPSNYTPLSIEQKFPPGDFSNGPGPAGDGSLSPKTDEGAVIILSGTSVETPYFRNTNTGSHNLAQETLSSPNRQMPSAVYFGSISTAPWQTLLFRPARSYHTGKLTHIGATSPPDYLMLDWFHMPIVEPYAISEPFSTAGKINLNAQIMPFGNYMRRETGLYAVLKSARMPVVPETLTTGTGFGLAFVTTTLSILPSGIMTRYPLNLDETVAAIRDRYSDSTRPVYLTNAEICSVDLVPEGYTKSGLANFWKDKQTTGDNLREGAYSTILPRLTARSNTYTVHVTAEALQTTEANGGWREGRGVVTAEWRGSYGIERYIDPNDSRFTSSKPEDPPHDFLQGDSVEPFYKFRILGEKRFDP